MEISSFASNLLGIGIGLQKHQSAAPSALSPTHKRLSLPPLSSCSLFHWNSLTQSLSSYSFSPPTLSLSFHLFCAHSLPPSIYPSVLKLIEAGGFFYSLSPNLSVLELPGISITLCVCENVYLIFESHFLLNLNPLL